jgi:hypothetical protein
MRANVTPIREISREVLQEEGELVAIEGALLRVRVSAGVIEARRAVSCLVAPEVDDRVLVGIGTNASWVLAVLERGAEQTIRLRAEGDLRVEAAGRLVLGGAEGVDVATPQAIRLASKTATIDAVETNVVSERFSLIAGLVRAESKTVHAVLGVLDSTLERLSQRVKRVYRFVEETDVTRAGQIDYRADDVASLRARHTVMAADELVKIDGKQIHLG